MGWHRLLLRPRNGPVAPALSNRGGRRRCGGLLARGQGPLAPSRSASHGGGPVACAAGSPLTVAGAAPVLHRTSLSHRGKEASTPPAAASRAQRGRRLT